MSGVAWLAGGAASTAAATGGGLPGGVRGVFVSVLGLGAHVGCSPEDWGGGTGGAPGVLPTDIVALPAPVAGDDDDGGAAGCAPAGVAAVGCGAVGGAAVGGAAPG